MKYILFAEAPHARGKLSEGKEAREKKIKARKNEEKYGKVILKPHFYATGKLVLVVEFDNSRQITNRMAIGAPDLIYKAYPLIPGPYWGAAMDEHHHT